MVQINNNTENVTQAIAAAASSGASAGKASNVSEEHYALTPFQGISQPYDAYTYQMLSCFPNFYEDLESYYFYLRCRTVIEFRALPWKLHPTNPNKLHGDNVILYLEVDRRWTLEHVTKFLESSIHTLLTDP